jgi:hypothetical protein
VRRALVIALAVAATTTTVSSCLEDPDAQAQFLCPSQEVFSVYVSPLMERRCGMLDCHGSFQRPMRLFGELGLRHPQQFCTPEAPEACRTAGDATTLLELNANYNAVCGVEPELTTEVASQPGGQAVNKLLLVRKARGQESHKGGKVFNPFDDADLCIVGWLRGDNVKSVFQACQRALDKLPDSVDLPAP